MRRQHNHLAGIVVIVFFLSLCSNPTSADRPDPDKPDRPDDEIEKDVDDPHSPSYYEEYGGVDGKGIEPFDYSYGPSPSPGDSIEVTVKLNATSSGTRLIRLGLGDSATVRKVYLSSGDSIKKVRLDIPSDIEEGWHLMRFTVMTTGESILFNGTGYVTKADVDQKFWIHVE